MRLFPHLLPALLLASCAEPVRPPAPPPDLRADPAADELIERAELLPRLFLERAPSPQAVEAAVARGPAGLDTLLGLPAGTSADLLVELRSRARVLRIRHPALDMEVRRVESQAAPACAPADLVDLARRIRRGPEAFKEDKVICQWLPYTAGLIGCMMAANPILYTACATVVMCNYCSGGWISSLCGH